MAITSYLCKRLFCTGSHSTLGKSRQSTRPCLQFHCSEQIGFGKFRRGFRSPKLTRPSLQCPIPVCGWVLRAAVRDCVLRTEGWWPGSCANSPGCDHARRAVHPAGFRGRNGRLEVFCAARLGVAHVDRLGMSSRLGVGPVGGAERVVRSRGRFWVPSEFSIKRDVWELVTNVWRLMRTNKTTIHTRLFLCSRWIPALINGCYWV